eukprot:PhF_6_TR34022/c0_g1_i1/m.49787
MAWSKADKRTCCFKSSRLDTDSGTLLQEANDFLSETKFIHEILQNYCNKSESHDVTEVYSMLQGLKDECMRLGGKWADSWEKHEKRLSKQHNMYFDLVRFLNPMYVFTHEGSFPSSEQFDHIFGAEIGFLENDWKEFVSRKSFDLASVPQPFTALKWLKHVGIVMHKRMAPTAIAMLSPPAIVMEVDSFFSVMDARFSSRQASIGKKKFSDILFVQANEKHVHYSFDEDESDD